MLQTAELFPSESQRVVSFHSVDKNNQTVSILLALIV